MKAGQAEEGFSAASPGTGGDYCVQIPDHELLRKIGDGSYGEVWLARCALGTYRAVKIVYRRNFSHERPYEREFSGIQKYEPISRSEAGLMDILQVGRNDPAGYFYYVMELADDVRSGAQINPESYEPHTLSYERSKRGRLPFEECLNIGLALSSALAHLHKHGLVHRDVKPSNIVFVNGVPELADIGLVTDIDEARSYVGTEGFIPPEGPGAPQADIYSLGKVLYEVSTGKDRFDYPELPAKLDDTTSQHDLMELNEIVIKACRADTGQRYQAAERMHADLLLVQRGRSIKHVRKLQRRLAFATRVGMLAVVAALLAAGAWLGSIKQIRRARAAEEKAEAMNTFLQELLLEGTTEHNAVSSNITLHAVLDKAAAKVDIRLAKQPEIAAAMHHILGEVYLSLDSESQAETNLMRAFELRQRYLGPKHPDTLETQDRIATLRQSQGRVDEAEALFRQILQTRRSLVGPESPATLASIQNLCSFLIDTQHPAEAEKLIRESLPFFERVHGTNSAVTLHHATGLALVLQMQGKLDEALPEAERLYAPTIRVLGTNSPFALSVANTYATVLQSKGRLAEAETVFRSVVDVRSAVQGSNHWNTLVAIHNLALCLSLEDKNDKNEEALSLYQQSADGFRSQAGLEDYRTLHVMNSMGNLLRAMGRTPEAVEILRLVLSLRTNMPGVSETLIGLGQALTENGKAAEAESLLCEALDKCQKATPLPARRIAEAQSALGACLTALGRYPDAEPLVLGGLKALEAAQGVSTNLLRTARSRVVKLYGAWGKTEEAGRWRTQAGNL
jgi:tetratricopeptide (TPR) repeat protein